MLGAHPEELAAKMQVFLLPTQCVVNLKHSTGTGRAAAGYLVPNPGFNRVCRRSVFLVATLALALAAAPVFAAGNLAAPDRALQGPAGGFVCFSIRPADAPVKPAAQHRAAVYRSCDELCAGRDAACTATTGMRNPP